MLSFLKNDGEAQGKPGCLHERKKKRKNTPRTKGSAAPTRPNNPQLRNGYDGGATANRTLPRCRLHVPRRLSCAILTVHGVFVFSQEDVLPAFRYAASFPNHELELAKADGPLHWPTLPYEGDYPAVPDDGVTSDIAEEYNFLW